MTAHDKLCARTGQPDTLGQEGLIASLFGEEAFISIDEPSMHNALRNVWVAAFGKDGVERLVPVVQKTVSAMLDTAEAELAAKGRVDLVPALLRPLPAYVIAHMMGVAEGLIPTVIEWADLMANATASGFPIDYANDPNWLASERAKEDLAAFLTEQVPLSPLSSRRRPHQPAGPLRNRQANPGRGDDGQHPPAPVRRQ